MEPKIDLSVISPKEGDTIVCTVDSHLSPVELQKFINKVAEIMKETFPDNLCVIINNNGDTKISLTVDETYGIV